MSISQRVPKYSKHAPSGQARVILNGKHLYLGKFGSAESQRKYTELLAQHCQSSPVIPVSKPGEYPSNTIDELLVQYLDHAESYYSAGGKPTKEFVCS